MLRELRQLKRAGSPDDSELIVFGSVTTKRIESTVKQSPCDQVVESRDNDRKVIVGDEEVGFDDGGHVRKTFQKTIGSVSRDRKNN
jgi:hypothetical protein